MLVLVTVLGCARPQPAAETTVAPPSGTASSESLAHRVNATRFTVDTIDAGLLHWTIEIGTGPFVVNVLDADRSTCWTPRAIKGGRAAAGRRRTSELAASLASEGGADRVGGAVNADFFLFAPPGVPTGAHVEDRIVITGPGTRPVFAVDSAGEPWIGILTVTGLARFASDSLAIQAWNRQVASGLSWFNRDFGERVDTASGTLRVPVTYARGGFIGVADSSGGARGIPSTGGLLSLGRTAAGTLRTRLAGAAVPEARAEVEVRLHPFHPRDAVGGFPVLVRDSIEAAGLDSAGGAGFGPVRHPRTLVGMAAGGRRLFLVTIDGRQPGYSVGMTLREAARLALDLGATEALNLDGGGSTTMAVRRDSSGRERYEVVNRPSDPQGERPVGNALALICPSTR